MLTKLDEFLLLELRRNSHFKANPGSAAEILSAHPQGVEPQEAGASARRLHADGLAKFVHDTERPGVPLLRITDSGMAYADLLEEASRKPTPRERLASITRSDWIALGAVVVSVFALFD